MDEDNWPVYDGEEGRDGTYRAIGRFITRFASVEMAMRHAVAQEVKIDFQFYHAVMTQDFAMLCSAFNRSLQSDLKNRTLEEKAKSFRQSRSSVERRARENSTRRAVGRGL